MAFQQYPQKFGIPSGNTAGRPANPVVGDTYYNGELVLLEIWNGSNWLPSSSPAATPVISSVTDVGTSRAYNNGALTVAFNAGTGGGPSSSFTVYAGTSVTTGTSSPLTITGLSGGTSYNVYAIASNNFGNSGNSLTAAATPTTVPNAPSGVTATIVGGTATISWTPPNNGGKTLGTYTITASTGGFSATAASSASSATISGLVAGTSYTFTVVASNANGNSVASNPSNSVTATLAIGLLVIGGGGGGGGGENNQQGGQGGGGGGGAYRYDSNFVLTAATTYSITVGSGGSGGASGDGDAAASGTKGGQSTFGSITAEGGGLGGGDARTGGQGGSAGGSGGDFGNDAIQPTNPLYGNASGTYNGYRSGKAGGGMGSAGSSTNLNGGAATSNTITGSSQFYCGGGGGARANQEPLSAGTGGTNAGNGANGGNGGSGTANFGGGGGGGGANGTGGSGGSGVVIARVPSASTSGLTITGSPTTTTDGSFTIYKWTGSGSLVTQ